MFTTFKQLLRNAHGTTAIEYAFVASLVSIAAVTAMSQLGVRVHDIMESVVASFL